MDARPIPWYLSALLSLPFSFTQVDLRAFDYLTAPFEHMLRESPKRNVSSSDRTTHG
ncbi:hypothetical protein BN2476_300169 [Paraburkholderia piptadeniae]|uniref:Uncharacterized protein n=1 Tax=Paraburkholderia piptadeniae TaxID=1701573 RepID=A0A1N7S320_9BURK|nr:hypothetical protein BN2476_300169 [Paraburkholderia piptadeniae]